MLVDLVIFDNDGVLVDSELLANRIFAELLSEAGVPTTVEQSIATYMGVSLVTARSLVLERYGIELPVDFEDRYYAGLFRLFETSLLPVSGVDEVLKRLTIPYCVASSGSPERIMRSLSLTGLDSYFVGRMFSAEQVERGKPAPDLFLLAASSLGIAPERCVVVEDSPFGIQAAHAAGMAAFGYAGLTPAERLIDADVIFDKMTELLSQLRAISRG